MSTTTPGCLGPAARRRVPVLTRLLAALGLLATAGAAQAQTPTFAVTTYSTGSASTTGYNNPYDVLGADLNRDGKPDLLVANSTGNSVGILLGNGNGTFQTARTFSAEGNGNNPVNLVVGDLNRDGNPDVVTGNIGRDQFSVFLGNGDGSLRPVVNYSPGSGRPQGVALADINGDGILDVLTANSSGNTASVLLGNGNGTFQTATVYPLGTGANPVRVAVRDVNGDGRLDLLTANYSSSSVSVLLGNSNGTFQAATNYSVGGGAQAIAISDVNGDGRLDLLTAGYNASAVSVLLSNGNGMFQAAVNYTTGSNSFPYDLEVADVNGDGQLDLVAAKSNSSNNSVAILLGNGNGTFQAPLSVGGGSNTYSQGVSVLDVNADSRPDILVANTSLQYQLVGSASVLLNTTPITIPALTGLNPTSGPVGTQVTLTGTNLTGATAVSFNSTAATTFSAVNATTITATVPSGATTGPVTVTTPSGTSNGVAFTVTPSNDDCTNATQLTVAATCTPTAGTTVGATQSLAAITCAGFTGNADDDVWYKFAASAATQTVTVVGSASIDAVVDVRAGSCSNSTNIGCADATATGGTESVTLNGLTPGSTYYVRVYGYGSAPATAGTFTICVTAPNTAAPVVTSPANNSTTNGSPTITGTAPAGSTVTVYLASGSGAAQAVGTTTATGGSFSFTPATALASGTYSVYATAQSSGATVSANSNTNTFTVDATAPTLVSFVRQSPTTALTNASAITYRLAFSEAVQNVRTALNVATTGSVGITGLSLTAVSASVYDVTLSGVAGNGTLTLTLAAQSGLADLVGNLYAGGAVSGPPYTIDQAAPAATVSTTASSPTSTSPIAFSVTFSEPVTGFGASSLSVSNGTVTGGTVSGSGSGPYTFSVTPTGNGSVTISVLANTAQDAAGNGNVASNSVSVQYTAPVASGLSVLYQTGDLGQPTDGQVRPFFQLVNSGTTAVPYSQLTVRYWLTVENFQGQLVTPIDYAQLGTSLVSARYVQLATPRQGALGYIEYSFAAGAGSLAASTNSGPIYGKAYKPDYSALDETDDWSYQTSGSFTTNDHVTLYQNGTLLSGTEPAEVTVTTALQVLTASRDASASPQYISVQLQVRNTGNVPVNYAGVRVRYYFTRNGNQDIVPELDYAQLGTSNVSVRVVRLPAPVNGADAYLEVRFAVGLGTFYPRSSTGDILFKLRKDDYSAFVQTDDYSFSAATALALNPRVTALVDNRLVFGSAPTGAPARVAASGQPTSAATGGATIVAAASGPLALTASPNPFGEQLTLRFALPTAQAYTLAVYDGQGRLVQQLASGQAEAEQTQEVAVPTQGYATGLYLVRLTTAEGVQTLKLVKR